MPDLIGHLVGTSEGAAEDEGFALDGDEDVREVIGAARLPGRVRCRKGG